MVGCAPIHRGLQIGKCVITASRPWLAVRELYRIDATLEAQLGPSSSLGLRCVSSCDRRHPISAETWVLTIMYACTDRPFQPTAGSFGTSQVPRGHSKDGPEGRNESRL